MNIDSTTAGNESSARLHHPQRSAVPAPGALLDGDHDRGHGRSDHWVHGHAHDLKRDLRRPRIYDSVDHPASPEALAVLAEGVRDADLAAPPVVLPDFFHKPDMEMPSSIAVATRDSIRPTLTSASVNCGMALIALDGERPKRTALDAFYRAARGRYPVPPGRRLELTHEEVLRSAVEGATFAVDRWGSEPDDIARIEEGGQLDLAPYGGAERVRDDLPWLLTQLSRMRFGTIGPSNHFLELQEVEEVLDGDTASRLGLHQGQITLQYHNGGGPLAGAMGALFGKRRKVNSTLRKVMLLQKPAYHLATARSLEQLRLRLLLYFGDGCPPVERSSEEGRRLMLSRAVAMNYGFAFRQATYASLRRLARQHLCSGSRLIVDSPHNSIYEEEVDGRPAVVHRHNASRAYGPALMAAHPIFSVTGQPVLVPGTNRTCSYVCVGTDESLPSLHTACHGTGSIIKDFANRGLCRPDPERRATLRYSYDSDDAKVVQHLDNRGVDEGLQIMVAKRLVRPVARLRPIAVLN
ncbi:MAG: RtcB family protein [Candidatus Dormibacteraeota bacterium]|nr:RtcB family protein [Candidatus Dormibacteraeota bacterium]